jgi:cyclophilin family peptidyl-prolyl cis-trans isomerase
VLETSVGRITLELEPDKAPKTVANFLLLVRGGFYDGLVFHRVKPNFIVQAGYVTADLRRRATTRPPVYNEADNGLKNVRGAVAMARTSYAHSATTEFFVNVADNAKLDFVAPTDAGFGYAVFGRVIGGMSAVDTIAATPTARHDEFADWPVRPITIIRASIDTNLAHR